MVLATTSGVSASTDILRNSGALNATLRASKKARSASSVGSAMSFAGVGLRIT